MNELINRYKFLRRNGWTRAEARSALAILSGKFLGKYAKGQ